MKVDELVGRKTVIVGEAGTGKTKLLAEILKELSTFFGPSEITVIDLAPERISGIGGPLSLYIDVSAFHYLRPMRVYAPRLMACNAEDLLRYAAHNAESARKLFDEYRRIGSTVLAVNDLTIFLHSGEVEELLKTVQRAKTFLATAYMGERLSEDFGTGLTRREKEKLNKFLEFVDNVIRLNSNNSSQVT